VKKFFGFDQAIFNEWFDDKRDKQERRGKTKQREGVRELQQERVKPAAGSCRRKTAQHQ
jgi:hypothetical protein